MRMCRLLPTVELPLHRRHVDNVPVRAWGTLQERSQPAVQNEGREGVDAENLDRLWRGHLPQLQQPAVRAPRIQLLPVCVALALRQHQGGVGGGHLVLRQHGELRQVGAAGSCRVQGCRFLLGAPRLQRPPRRLRLCSGRLRLQSEQPGPGRRQGRLRSGARLALQQVLVVRRRPAHGLARVVHQDVQPRLAVEQVLAEGLDRP
mmetsp:Transcript_6207/g.16823  ORF Transcript_6207/g.16823 Transcript_6207/m.16823 type:complete len:204 (+) Transcript_6207:413-1024(+)